MNLPELVAGWVGDSRAYWLPDDGESRLLTTDDSWAAEQIADGVPRATAESGPQAHAITRWLGVDAPDHAPRTVSIDLDGAGWVLVCSDGLWNYCSEARRARRPRARPRAGRRVRTRCRWPAPSSTGRTPQGGQDNITVALARIGPAPQHSPAPPA